MVEPAEFEALGVLLQQSPQKAFPPGSAGQVLAGGGERIQVDPGVPDGREHAPPQPILELKRERERAERLPPFLGAGPVSFIHFRGGWAGQEDLVAADENGDQRSRTAGDELEEAFRDAGPIGIEHVVHGHHSLLKDGGIGGGQVGKHIPGRCPPSM